jgi:hypothetical protein
MGQGKMDKRKFETNDQLDCQTLLCYFYLWNYAKQVTNQRHTTDTVSVDVLSCV